MISLDLVQKLREKTGLGLMDCKKALIETNGDIDKAVELLRKKGSIVAEKRAENKTSCGFVHAYIHQGGQIGVLIEINCETDFVAQTSLLKEFAHNISMHIAAMNPLYIRDSEVPNELIEKEKNIFKEQMKDTKKPETIINSILEGKIKKYYTDICLLSQAYIKNDKITVSDYLVEITGKLGEKIKINRFSRFEIGY